MAKTNLQLKSLEVGTEKKMTTTITYVNPDADSATLKEFGQMLNDLTANTYVETNRIQTINVDTEQTPKKQGSIEFVSNPQFTKYAQTIQIKVDQLIINGATSTTLPTGIALFGQAINQSIAYGIRTYNNELIIETINAVPTGTYNIQLAVKETDNYTAATTTTTITVS